MKKTNYLEIFVVIFSLFIATVSWGQTTFSWNFGTSSGSASPSSGSLANLTVGDVSIGNTYGSVTMLSTTSASSGYTGASGQYNAGNACRTGALNTGSSGSAYFQFTLTPEAGYAVNLSSISFGARSTSTAPQAYTLRSSLDSYASDIATGSISNNSTWSLKTNSSLDFEGTSGTAITFRLYGYNGSGTANQNTINWRIDDLSIVVSLTSSSSPLITVSQTNLSDFTYVYGNGPSSEKSFTISGENLTDDITITPPSSFEISTGTGGSFSAENPITLTETGGVVDETTIYVRLKAGLDVDEYNENITATSDGASDKTVQCTGEITPPADPEPSEHVTVFTATKNSDSQITVTWTDAAGAQLPSAYLVKAAIDPATPAAPSDGTEEANTTLIKNISYGVEEAVFTGLENNTTYNFLIWPYTNSGTDIDYKTDGTIPSAQAKTDAAPTLIFSENMGNVSSTTAISAHTDWENSAPVAFSGDADVRSSTASSGYTGASGLANIFFTNTINKYFLIEGINVKGYKDITLSLGHYKSTIASSNELKIEVSSDGSTWTELSYTRATGAGTASWTLIEPTGTIPANVENLRLRFTQTSATPQFRIDDIKLYGFPIEGATYNTVDIEGTNSGWQAAEVFPNITDADNAHFTWDENYLYFAVSAEKADYNNMATYLFINSNLTNNSKTSSTAYGWGEYLNVPFRANYVFIWKNDPGNHFMQLATYEDGSWNTTNVPTDSVYLGTYGIDGVINFKIGSNYREIKIHRQIFGLDGAGKQIKIASITEEQWGNYWRTFGWPEEGWTDGDRAANQTISNYYQYNLDEYVLPNEAQYLKKDISTFNNTIIESDTTFNNVFIEPNKTLTIDNGYTLTIDGNLVIFSDVNGTGSFIDNGALDVSGNVIVQSYLADSYNYGWYVSSPLSNAKGNVFDGSDGVYTYDSEFTEWDEVFSGDNLEPVRGYVTKYGTGTGANNKTVEYIGVGNTLNSGTKTSATLYRTGYQSGNYGWNLIGNPYPSAIDWDAASGITKTNLINSTHVRKVNGSVATYIDGEGVNDGSRYIAPGQAFWVQVAGSVGTPTGTGEITFDNDCRVHQNISLIKSTSNGGFRLTVERDGIKDEIVLRFKNGATDAFDNMYDAVKMFSENNDIPQIYSLNSNNEQMAINSFPELTVNKSVNIGFETEVAGTFTLTAGDMTSFGSNVSILLEDTYTNSIINLQQQNTYNFNSTVTANDDRFIVHFVLSTTDANTPGNNEENTTIIYTFDNSIYISNIMSNEANTVVYNMLGQEIITQKLQQSALNKLNTSLSPGQYIVKVTDGTQISTQKVFIY